ncbi:hypothetical protein TNCT_89171, partial [Trichonephila clavata]
SLSRENKKSRGLRFEPPYSSPEASGTTCWDSCDIHTISERACFFPRTIDARAQA